MKAACLVPRRVRSAVLRTLAHLLPASVRRGPAPSAPRPEPRPADTGTPRPLPGIHEEWLNDEHVEEIALVRPYVQLTPMAVPMNLCCDCGTQHPPGQPCTDVRELTT